MSGWALPRPQYTADYSAGWARAPDAPIHPDRKRQTLPGETQPRVDRLERTGEQTPVGRAPVSGIGRGMLERSIAQHENDHDPEPISIARHGPSVRVGTKQAYLAAINVRNRRHVCLK